MSRVPHLTVDYCHAWGEDTRWWMRALDRIRKGHSRHICHRLHLVGTGMHAGPHLCRCNVAWS